MRRVFISDCEGPITINDNAFELMSHFVPHGDKIFTVTSRYDDTLADVLRRSGYKAGDTLKLVLPFLKAYDVTDEKITEFSARNIILLAHSKKSLQHILKMAPAYIVSTSYEHYIKALCNALKFPFKNTYCTKVKLDKYDMNEQEKTRVRELAKEIAEMSIFDIPSYARSFGELPENVRSTIERLDEIFWEDILEMRIGEMYLAVDPVGGCEKADATSAIAEKMNVTLAEVMYVGDSITDKEAFKLVKEDGGLTLSFNGNRYAIENSEIAVMSKDSLVTAIVADIFIRFGKTETLELVAEWNDKTLNQSHADQSLVKTFLELSPCDMPKLKIITNENREKLAMESAEFRKQVRGEMAGGLG